MDCIYLHRDQPWQRYPCYGSFFCARERFWKREEKERLNPNRGLLKQARKKGWGMKEEFEAYIGSNPPLSKNGKRT